MTIKLINTDTETKRIEIVPRENAVIEVISQGSNPTLTLEESGELKMCLTQDDRAYPFFEIHVITDIPA